MKNDVIGIIGLGIIGSKIATKILENKVNLMVYDIDKLKMDSLFEIGAVPAISSNKLFKTCDIILLSLPSPETIKKIVLENINSDTKGKIIIDLSTNSPEVVETIYMHCKNHDNEFIDSPLTGGVLGALNGTFTAMLGGESSSIQSVIKVIELFTNKIVHVGPTGYGAKTKLLHNMIGEIQVYAFAEAFAIAKKIGLDTTKVYEVFSNGMINSKILNELYANGSLSGNYEPQATIKTAEKDQRLVTELASKVGIELLLTPTIYSNIQKLINKNMENEDVTSAILLFEEKYELSTREPYI